MEYQLKNNNKAIETKLKKNEHSDNVGQEWELKSAEWIRKFGKWPNSERQTINMKTEYKQEQKEIN